MEASNYDSAISAFERDIEIAPDLEEAYHQIAEFYDEQGLEDDDVWYYKAAIFLYEEHQTSAFTFELSQETA